VDVSIDRTSDIIAEGAIPAIFTGFGLIWLMRNPRIEPEHSLESINITAQFLIISHGMTGRNQLTTILRIKNISDPLEQ
jgi:hypothetical protein